MPRRDFDAVVVGAGFSGLSCLHELRRYGFSCRLFEAGSGIGGIWLSNSYPGARVDSEYFIYQFHQPEIGRDFHWTERFPGRDELMAYFHHIEQRHNFSRDISFNTRVTGATYDDAAKLWTVATSDGKLTVTQHLILCTGFGSKRYYAPIPGRDSFIGQCFHTSDWLAASNVDFKGKRVAVIGTGASGVQCTQEIGPVAAHLTVFQRTPNLAIPMQQKKRSDDWEFPDPKNYSELLDKNMDTFAAIKYDIHPQKCVDVSSEERQAFFEGLFEEGGFAFWIGTYSDILYDSEANHHAYEFWRETVRARIHDPVKRDLLAPAKAPHPFGTKRPSLEQTYYEVFNQSNVDLVDVNTKPIKEITPKGILLKNGEEVEVDIIIMATGFDSVTGGILDINIRNGSNESLAQCWSDGIQTLLGMMAPRFENLYFLYGPQACTAFANGPTLAKLQSDWILQLLAWVRMRGKRSVMPKIEGVERWSAKVHDAWNNSLFPLANSWYQGNNIPGKRVEPLNFAGGVPVYKAALQEYSANDYEALEFQ